MKLKKHILSKSTFVSGLQCQKKLYLNAYFKKYKDPISENQQAVFDRGHRVGKLAQQIFLGGVDASAGMGYNFQKIVERTQQLIQQGENIIYEAAFQHDQILVIFDILVRTTKGFVAYEVKSSTKLSQTHIYDASIQYYVAQKCGIKIYDIAILHINTAYIRKGTLNLKKLFKAEKIKKQVLENQEFVEQKIDEFKQVLLGGLLPQIDIGPHCTSPYTCDFKGYCHAHIPKLSVFNIAGLAAEKKWQLYNKNILSLKDVPEQFDLNDKQRQQINCSIEQRTELNKEQLSKFLSTLNLPLFFIDFETFAPAIPLYDNTSPYKAVVFQYSLHILRSAEAELEHKEFIAKPDGKDPRIDFTKQIIQDCETQGDLIVYNIGFERSKLQELAELYPEKKQELNALIKRMKDLMIPFQKRWYYDHKMNGSHSIKNVLPALVPELSYKNLEIQEGQTASNKYLDLQLGIRKNTDETMNALSEYCKLDTLAMVKIYEVLNNLT